MCLFISRKTVLRGLRTLKTVHYSHSWKPKLLPEVIENFFCVVAFLSLYWKYFTVQKHKYNDFLRTMITLYVLMTTKNWKRYDTEKVFSSKNLVFLQWLYPSGFPPAQNFYWKLWVWGVLLIFERSDRPKRFVQTSFKEVKTCK